MSVRRGLVLALVTTFCCEQLCSQKLATAYSVDQGLPQSTVTSIYRDNEAYLWVGTGDGLGLFDGWNFHQVRSSSDKKNTITNSSIRGIVASSDQKTIWVGTEGGVNQFDRFTLSLLKHLSSVKVPGVMEVPIFANDTAVWILSGGAGLFRMRIADGRSTLVSPHGFEGSCGVADRNNSVFYTDNASNLIWVDLQTNTSVVIPLPFGLNALNVKSIVEVPSGAGLIVLLTDKGLFQLNGKSKLITRLGLGDNTFSDSTMAFRSMAIHPDGSWWFGITGQGVYRYDPMVRKIRPCLWQQDGTYVGGMLKAPTQIICDDYGVVWCGTDGNGLVKLLHSRIVFHEKFSEHLVTDTCKWFTRCFYEISPEKYLVGTYKGGLELVDHESNSIHKVGEGDLWKGVTPLFITESGDGRLLIGTDQSLLLMDPRSWETEKVEFATYNSGSYTGFLRTADGRLLIYGSKGLFEFSGSSSPQFSASPIGGCSTNVSSVFQMTDGRIIVSVLAEGFAVLNAKVELIENISFEAAGLPSTVLIRGMCNDIQGGLWIGTNDGLVLMDNQFRISKKVTTADGLSDNTIYDLDYIGTTRTIVLTTGHGITFFDPVANQFVRYSHGDGLPSDECNSGALLHAPSGLLYVGTVSGFVRWNPNASGRCFKNSLVLSSLTSDPDAPGGILRESIVRDHGNSTIELLIWQTDFAFPEKVIFEYQLDGSDEKKTTVQGLLKLNYASLASGFYGFMCSASVPGCPPARISKLFTIKIVPPFWMSGWFIGLTTMGGVLLITLVLFVIMRLRFQRKIRKLKMQQELDKVRQRISRDIHDEIGAGLTRIALSGDLMSQKFLHDDPSFDKLKWIAGTARELSQNMKEVVWSVNPHYDSLDHMVAYFRSHTSGVAENADMRFSYSGEENLPELHVNPESRRNLLLILKETLSNMGKHANATEVALKITWHDNLFSMSITDNGKGFDLNSPEGVNSNGLRNIRQRAESIGFLVSITSSIGKGTQIKVSGQLTQ